MSMPVSVSRSVHFSFLPMSSRVLFSMVLLVFGLGYIMAMIQVWVTHVGLDGKDYLTAKDLMIAYSGNPEGTKLEAALHGPMSGMLGAAKKQIIFNWLHNGAKKDGYESQIKPILQSHCVVCHNPKINPHLPNLTSYEGVSKVTTRDKGMTIPTLVRVAHIHLFGITFIFFIVGYIFTHSYVKPLWLKCVLIAAPFIVLITDVASWYLTKVWTGFAWVVIISGLIMGISFAGMWIISMYQMWFYKVPQELMDRNGRLPGITLGTDE